MPTLIRLFTDLSVYREITVDTFFATFRRYSLAYLLLSLALSFWINEKYAPQVYPVIDSLTNQVLTTIPESAVFELRDGILTATATTSSNYFAIDASADAPALASSAAFLTLGKTHFRLTTDIKGAHEIRSYEEEGWQNLSLTGKDIRREAEAFQTGSQSVKPYLPLVLTLPIFLGFFLARLVHSFFYALLLRLFSSTLNRSYRFSHYLKLVLHTVIVADTINLLVLMIYQQSYSLVFTAAFFGTTLLAYLNLPIEPKPPSNQAT